MHSNALYITRSHDGVWYYQRWIPITIYRQSASDLPRVFKVTLKTKNPKVAARLSRKLTVYFDKLIIDSFDKPEHFGEAMRLLYLAAKEGHSLYSYEALSLDDFEEFLLNKATSFRNNLENHIATLEKQVEGLSQALKHQNQEELLDKIRQAVNPPPNDKVNPTLEGAFEEWKEKSKGRLSLSSFNQTYVPQIDLFVRYIQETYGNKSHKIRINEIKPHHVNEFHDFYKQIPKRCSTSKFSITELIGLKGDKKGTNTICQTYANISTFLRWMQDKAYAIDDTVCRVMAKGSDVKMSGRKDAITVLPFSDDDLAKIYNSENYQKYGKFYTSAMYWVPLIALFTGARSGEILQLETKDIIQDSDTWLFNITETEDDDEDDSDIIDNPSPEINEQTVKNEGSKRTVPIHKQLLKMGFLEYVRKCNGRLFPDEPRYLKDGKFKSFGKRWSTLLKKHDIKPKNRLQRKNFHSFRHTVITRLMEIQASGENTRRYSIGFIHALVGHVSAERSEAEKTYTHSEFIKARKEALSRLSYPSIEFDKILSWKRCVMNKNRK